MARMSMSPPPAYRRITSVSERGAGAAEEGGLGVDPGVGRPGLQVAAGDADVDRIEPEGAVHPRLIEGVGHRDLAELHESAVLDELRGRAGEAAPSPTLVPVRLID